MPEPLLGADAFALDVSDWVNSAPISPESLRGRVVVVEAFQMLCPGCVSHGLPLAQRLHGMFDSRELVVLGLHTVFEHHAVMGREALEAFLSEYRIEFPVAIDRPLDGQAIPATMHRYGLRGTPSTIIVDREGRVRQIAFGAVDELALGTYLGRLLAEPTTPSMTSVSASMSEAGEACSIDGVCT
ncbi:TlpA disulfide reductase family protein [Microbacterium maritypicum]|uniref:peroxiredoxin family protein n=1 Tax=Microbacterium TaxID=33882 RepID=UPI0025F9C724|nr:MULTISPECIES: TlpA disulfide reductase family protein [Microbacterium]